MSSVGLLQVCAGHEAVCEAAIHAMHTISEDEKIEAVLLVDAANAFNSVNRQVFLHNICIICHPMATYVKKVKLLSEIAKIEPQCALSCFISGYKHKLNYYMRTVPNISNLLRHIDDFITKEFIPAITGGAKCFENERKLLSLPPKLGGLGIPIFSEKSDFEYSNSKIVTKQLCEKIIQQERQYNRDNKIKEIKNKITRTRLTLYHQILVDVRAHMNENQQRLNDVNQKPRASSWISSLPLEDERYVLNKQLF